MTPAQKKAYNEKYYREHSNYWKDFYSKGRLVGRPKAHGKNTVSGGSGVNRRGDGLGTGPVGASNRPGKKEAIDPSLNAWSNLVSQTGTPLQSYAYNEAVGVQNDGPMPDMTYDDLVTYMSGTFFDNALSSAKAAKSKAVNVGKDFVKSWKQGVTSIKSLFRKKGR